MEIQEKIQDDMKAALKSGDKLVLETLRMLRAQIKNVTIAKGEDLSEEDVFGILSKEVKKRKESIKLYKEGGREELAEKEENEMKVLSAYMPEELTPEELDTIVSKAISETDAEGLKDMGKVMGAVMPQVKGRADGKVIQDLVKAKLS
ncbi:GatB/YqeY domain-containing protein [bacterium]